MERWVIDASVAVKWVVPERHGVEAGLVLDAAVAGRVTLHVPSLWGSEVANALWQKTRRREGRLTVAEAIRSLRHLQGLGIERHDDRGLIDVAFALACEAGVTVYDALYAALSVREDARLITDDEPIAERLSGTEAGERVVLLHRVSELFTQP